MSNKLEKNLNLVDIFCLASGAMISSGIFILPGLAYKEAGPGVFLSYFLAGILAFVGTLSVIELSTAMPKAGGDYYFITRSLGPLMGTISSFLSWTALCLKSAFAIFGIAEIVNLNFQIPVILSSSVICLFFVILNISGVKESIKLQVFLVIALFLLMFFYVAGGLKHIDQANFTPFFPSGLNNVLITSGFVFISFGGLINIASISGEVSNPVKNIPLGMILSVVCVTLVYTLMLIVTVGVLPGSKLSGSLTPIADTGVILFGRRGGTIISVGALLAFVTTANAGIFSASRYPLALSRDKLLPDIFAKITKNTKVPVISIITTGLFIFIFLMLNITTLVKVGSTAILTLYILTNLAVIILREGNIHNYSPPFKVPFYPWTNIAGIALFTFLVVDMGVAAVEISLAIVFIAVLLYFLYGRKKHNIEYGLMHLLEKVINKKITSERLEEELKEVIIERDQLKIDRVHKLFDDSIVLDLNNISELNEMLELLASQLSKDIKLAPEEVKRLLLEREAEGSTAISSFVAIPHIIIPGENKFLLVVLRCSKGIRFNQDAESVKAVFVLFGTQDERTFHLKVLAAIAQIVQNKSFENKWMTIKSEANLKDFLLLSERTRH